MKRMGISALLIMIISLSCATLAFASLNDMSLQETIESFLRYDFNTVKDVPDRDARTEESTLTGDGSRVFEPLNVNGGWLFDLAGGGKLGVRVGTLEFNEGALVERYIDIKGENGEVRLLRNSFSAGSAYNKTLFWSFKQQEGASIVKGSIGEVKCAVLYELPDGSCYLYGYIESDGTDFWSLELPQSACYFAAKAPSEMFAFAIFRQLDMEDGDRSIFISPLSIATALTMTYQGAGTTTKEAMAKALGYTGIDDGKLNESYRNLLRHLRQLDEKVELNIGNSLWIREGEVIKEDFLAANRDIFDASVTPLDFAEENAAEQINQWVSAATNKKIEKMVDSSIPSDIIMYLINAIYFKGDWAEQFDKKNTFGTKFRAGDGSNHEVMMMSRKGKVEYGQGDNFKAVRLPYGSGKTAIYCILPEESESINDFIAGLNVDRWWKVIMESLSERDEVLLRLPRFKLEYGIKNLNDSLTALGMGEAFTNTADFSGICENVYISRVLHKAVIEVNEEGSEAAAATGVEMKLTAVAEPLTFITDRPFLFVITDDETGTILFMGKLYDVE